MSREENPIVEVESVGKKFCKNFRRSLWYGVCDVANELVGRSDSDRLRPDEFWANHDVSFEVAPGESFGLIGHNGAGKTTLLKMLNGLIKPDAGRLRVRGRVGALIALGAGFNPLLSGRENIYVNGAVLGHSKRYMDEIFDSIVEFAELADFIDAPVQSYSSGMHVRLGFAVAIHMKPDLMLVDEVLAVGDTAFQRKCYDQVERMQREGTAFIVVTHNPYQLERMCHRIAVLEHGRLHGIFEGKDAIAAYHQLGSLKRVQSGGTRLEADAADDRPGSGVVRLNALEVVNPAGEAVEQLSALDPVIFRMRCSTRDRVSGLRFSMFVYSHANVLVNVISSSGQTEDLVVEGDVVVDFRIPSLRLMTDRYYVEVRLHHGAVRSDVVSRAKEFSVVVNDPDVLRLTHNGGIFAPEGTWSVKGKPT